MSDNGFPMTSFNFHTLRKNLGKHLIVYCTGLWAKLLGWPTMIVCRLRSLGTREQPANKRWMKIIAYYFVAQCLCQPAHHLMLRRRRRSCWYIQCSIIVQGGYVWPSKLPSISVLTVIRFPSLSFPGKTGILTGSSQSITDSLGTSNLRRAVLYAWRAGNSNDHGASGNSYRLHFNPSGDDGNVVIVWRPKPWELPAQEKPNHFNSGPLKLDDD